MFHDFCERGVCAALESFGFSKEARDMAWFKKMLAEKMSRRVEKMRARRTDLDGEKIAAPSWWPGWRNVGDTAKRMMIGDPKTFVSQLSKGELHKPGGMWRESLKPQGPLDALMLYGFPALGMYQAMKAPPEMRGSAIGGTVGGAVGGMLGMPLGMVGNTIGSNLVGRLGQAVGHSFDAPVHRPQFLNRPRQVSRQPTEPTLSEQMSAVTGRPTKL